MDHTLPLPNELWITIMFYLRPRCIMRLRLICHNLDQLVAGLASAYPHLVKLLTRDHTITLRTDRIRQCGDGNAKNMPKFMHQWSQNLRVVSKDPDRNLIKLCQPRTLHVCNRSLTSNIGGSGVTDIGSMLEEYRYRPVDRGGWQVIVGGLYAHCPKLRVLILHNCTLTSDGADHAAVEYLAIYGGSVDMPPVSVKHFKYRNTRVSTLHTELISIDATSYDAAIDRHIIAAVTQLKYLFVRPMHQGHRTHIDEFRRDRPDVEVITTRKRELEVKRQLFMKYYLVRQMEHL